jgi:predicted O-methyltransferase YrrM
LWLAEALRATGGRVTTLESAEYKVVLAQATFRQSGLERQIDLVHADAGRYLHKSGADAYDVVFLDADRQEYPGWWPELRRTLRPGGLLVVDNATSHVEEMAPFVALVAADAEFTTCLVPVGNGEFLAAKGPA